MRALFSWALLGAVAAAPPLRDTAESTDAAAPVLPPGSDIPPTLINGGKVTVSGLSSGAYQAVQMHMSFSLTIKGAGVLAGGPYWCAQDDVIVALGPCMTTPSDISVDYLAGIIENTAAFGFIDPLSGLRESRVWLFSGTNDTVVDTGVVRAAAQLYGRFVSDAGSQVVVVNDVPSEHAQITPAFGNGCSFLGEPYINACAYDAAGSMLQWLYSNTLTPPSAAAVVAAPAATFCAIDAARVPTGRPAAAAMAGGAIGACAPAALRAAPRTGSASTPVLRGGNGTLYEFNQGLFVGGGGWSTDVGLAQMAFVYIPDACLAAGGAPPPGGCLLHMAFHGCEQTLDDIGHLFMTGSNYVSWADANGIVVVFPQAISNLVNPKGCHDWWGYTGTAYASNWGTQPLTMKRILDSIMGIPLTPNRTDTGAEDAWRQTRMSSRRRR